MSVQEIKSWKVPGFWWKTDDKNRLYQYYKVTLAVYLCSMSFYGWRDQKLNPKNVHGRLRVRNKVHYSSSQFEGISKLAKSVKIRQKVPYLHDILISEINLSAGSGPFGDQFFSKPSEPTELQDQELVENS